MQNNSDLNSAVEFICRNSVRSAERTNLIRCVVRTYMCRKYEFLRKDVREKRVSEESTPVLAQFMKRGFV